MDLIPCKKIKQNFLLNILIKSIKMAFIWLVFDQSNINQTEVILLKINMYTDNSSYKKLTSSISI